MIGVVQNGIFYFIWIAISIFFLLLGGIILTKKYLLLPRIVRFIFMAVLIVGLLLFIFVETLILTQFKANTQIRMDYIIILGALIKDTGPSTTLRMRLDQAIAYLELYPETQVIVSGGQGTDEPISEALGMKIYLMQKGIEEERIVLEANSRNTNENLKLSSELLNLQEDKVGIVTSNFHVFRALQIANKQGYNEIYGIAAPSHLGLLFTNLVREFFAIVKDFLVGNLGPL